MAKRHDSRRVKINRSYTLSEAADRLGVVTHTLRRWIDAGLPLIERKRPYLIHGSELRAFLKSRAKPKQHCRAGELYCVSCRAPKRPAFDEVDFVPKTSKTGQLVGLCPTCGSLIYRLTRTASLALASSDLKVTRRPAQ